MNIDQAERERREKHRQALRAVVADLQDAEADVVAAAEAAVIELIRRNYPVVVGCALQSGSMGGLLTLEIAFDLKPGSKAVEVRAVVQPPPIASTVRREVADVGA